MCYAVDQFVVVQPGVTHFLPECCDDAGLLCLLGRAPADDRDRLVEVEVRRDDTDAAVVLQSLGLAIDVAGIGIHAVRECESVLSVGDRMPAVEKVGDIGEAAAELVDDIGCVAKSVVGIEHQRVPKRKGIACLRQFVPLKSDSAIELVRIGKVGKVEPAQRREAPGDVFLPRRDARRSLVLPLVRERRQLVLGNAQDGRVLRIFGEHLFGDALQLPCQIAACLLPGGPVRDLATRKQSRRRCGSKKLAPANHCRHRPLLSRAAL